MTRLPDPFFEAVFLHRAMAAVSMLEGPRTVIGGDFNWDGLHLTQEGTRLERRAGARADDDECVRAARDAGLACLSGTTA